ncbi:hypothetical protein [Kitasatospora sp. A2-31]|uniref:hypothetical protein n=1 Tax=Kitasatospora sp. A2-31 TaxID=2916414 RepID=UPI001EE9E7A8|nr:hypothetical protein [Kitasatospora sp. A2-31]MCG6495834.1 hypothetical protein [Kitasatospora sp. A2-31]
MHVRKSDAHDTHDADDPHGAPVRHGVPVRQGAPVRHGVPVRQGAPVRRWAGVLLALLLVGAAAACGSSGSGSSASPSPTLPTAATGSPTGSAGGTGSPTAGATAPADVAAAKSQVTANWEKFFDPNTSIPDKAALLQNGEELLPVLQGFSQDPRVGQVKARVTDVSFNSATEATVTYELSLQGTVVEPSATGQAVLENGTWKVSRASLCGLLTQAGGATGTPIPGCS